MQSNNCTIKRKKITTDVEALTKTVQEYVEGKSEEIADLTQRIGYAHDKLEGIWLINPTTIGVLNDDDFATWSNKGKLQQKYLDKNQTVIDTNTLYIIDTKQK